MGTLDNILVTENLPLAVVSNRKAKSVLRRPTDNQPGLDCYVLKLDVEGSEVETLAGASALIGSGRLAAVFVEDNPRLLRLHNHNGLKLQKALQSAGFET